MTQKDWKKEKDIKIKSKDEFLNGVPYENCSEIQQMLYHTGTKIVEKREPNENDSGYNILTLWYSTDEETLLICINNLENNSIWKEIKLA